MANGLILALIFGAVSIGVMESGFLFPKEYPVVETSLGLVKGHSAFSRDGRKYFAFVGIPYAQPPVGPLRFEVFLVLMNSY
jgi:hypothetical protein